MHPYLHMYSLMHVTKSFYCEYSINFVVVNSHDLYLLDKTKMKIIRCWRVVCYYVVGGVNI